MPSEPDRGDPWIASQGLGILCAQATVLLLAVGSVVLAATKDGVSRDIRMDDIRPFFEQPSGWHAWFYLLLAVLLLYAVNTAWCTTLSVLRRWRSGQRRPSAYAGALMHVGFLVGLLAHLLGGLGGAERGTVLLDTGGGELGPGWEGAQGRLLDLDIDVHPDGSQKRLRATVELTRGEHTATRILAWNRPLTHGSGSHLLLLQDYGIGHVAVITDGVERCAVREGELCTLDRASHRATRLLTEGGHWGDDSVAAVGGVFLVAGRPTRLRDGNVWTLETIEERTTVALRSRHSPGAPLALLMVAVFCLGMTLMGRRWL